MPLTNSNSVNLLKMEDFTTSEIGSPELHSFQDDSRDLTKSSIKSESSFDSLQRKLRQMENEIFLESTEIFKILNEANTLMVDGLSYEKIQQSQELCSTLHLIRENSPIYQHLSSRKKSFLMKRLGQKYFAELKSSDFLEEQNQAPVHKNQSQSQTIKTNISTTIQMVANRSLKQKPIKKATQMKKTYGSKRRLNKKVHFSTKSDCKYFSSNEPPQQIQQGYAASIKTF